MSNQMEGIGNAMKQVIIIAVTVILIVIGACVAIAIAGGADQETNMLLRKGYSDDEILYFKSLPLMPTIDWDVVWPVPGEGWKAYGPDGAIGVVFYFDENLNLKKRMLYDLHEEQQNK